MILVHGIQLVGTHAFASGLNVWTLLSLHFMTYCPGNQGIAVDAFVCSLKGTSGDSTLVSWDGLLSNMLTHVPLFRAPSYCQT